MAKITPYKLARVGATQGKVAPSVATARLTTISVNRLGSAVTGMGGVVDDIRRIQVLRIKDTKLAEKLERKRLQRERDQAAEEQTEQNALMKKGGIKSKLKPTGKQKGWLDSILPKWLQLLKPVFEFIASVIAIPVIREMLKWWGDPENAKKIETFFEKAGVIFTKLREFGNWLINDKIFGGWSKLTDSESTFKERIEGLGDLLKGIGVAAILLNPFSTFGYALTGLGWLVKNISGWLEDPFAFLRLDKPSSSSGGNKNVDKGKSKKVSDKQKLKNKYQKYKANKGGLNWRNKVKLKTIKLPDGSKISYDPKKTRANYTLKDGTKITVKGKTPFIDGITKNKTLWQSVKTWGSKTGTFLKQNPLKSLKQTGQFALKHKKGIASGVKGFGVGYAIDWAVDNTIMKGMDWGFHQLRKKNLDNDIDKHGIDKVIGGLNKALDKESKLPKAPWWNMGYKLSGVHYDEKKIEELHKRLEYANEQKKKIDGGISSEVKNVLKKEEQSTPKKGNWFTNLFSSGKSESKQPEAKVEKKVEKKKKTNWWSNLFGSNKKKEKKQNFVTPKQTFTKKETTKKKPWWKLWMSGGQHKKLPEFFLGKIFKKVTKTIGNVVSGVGKAVSGIVNTVGDVISNPIVSTALSFVPGVGPIIGAINAVQSLQQGDILGAAMGAWGALGNFAAIGSTAKSIVNTPDWMLNLRMSGFGQGLASMHSGISGAISGITSGWNNFMGSDIGKLGKNIFTGLTGGGWGGAIQQGLGMTGLMDEGAFFGAGGTMSKFGSFLSNNNLSGIGNMFPGLGNMISNSPFGGLPGLSELFDGSFSPMSAIAGMAENAGAGGLFRSVMGMYQGTTDYYSGIKAVAEDIGIGTEAFGIIDKGRDLYNKSKQFALEQPDIEIIPLIAPIILEQPVIAPKVKKQLMRIVG